MYLNLSFGINIHNFCGHMITSSINTHRHGLTETLNIDNREEVAISDIAETMASRASPHDVSKSILQLIYLAYGYGSVYCDQGSRVMKFHGR